jgi:hypothetical protein
MEGLIPSSIYTLVTAATQQQLLSGRLRQADNEQKITFNKLSNGWRLVVNKLLI